MTEIKDIDENGFNFLSKLEGEKLYPYLDTKGIPTIGIGCTYYENGVKVKMTDKSITKERSRSLASNLLNHYELCVYSTTRDDINQDQFNALVFICYNIGIAGFKSSNILRYVNLDPNDKTKILAGFLGWTSEGSLLTRRLLEYGFYFSIPFKQLPKIYTSATGKVLTSKQSNILTTF